MTRILLTGASGYLGSAVATALEAEHVIRLQHRTALPQGRGEVRPGALADLPSLRKAIEGCTVVIHAAGLASEFEPTTGEFERVNESGTRNVLAAASECGARVVFVSSVLAIGPGNGRVLSEVDIAQGVSVAMPYQRSKQRATAWVRAQRNEGNDVRVVYPAALVGWGAATEGNWLGRMMTLMQQRRLRVLPTVGRQRFCIAPVADVARGIAAAALAEPARARHGDWILGGDNAHVADIYAVLQAALGERFPRLWPSAVLGPLAWVAECAARWRKSRPVATRAGLVAFRHDWAYSSEKACAELGYQSSSALEAVRDQAARLLQLRAGES